MSAGVIGKGLSISGELHGEDDLVIEGHVAGTIKISKSLTIGKTGTILADVETENVTIQGKMTGNVVAREKIHLQNGGQLEGDMSAPRVEVEDGARYKGKITTS